MHCALGHTCNTAQNKETSAGSRNLAIEKSIRRVCQDKSGVDGLKSDLDKGDDEEERAEEGTGEWVGEIGEESDIVIGDEDERRDAWSILTQVILAHKTNLIVVAREERYGLSQRRVLAASFHFLDTRAVEYNSR